MTQSNQKPSNKNLKRASVPGAGGSITVEAALSVPIFFFAVVCLIYFIEIHNVQTTIRAAAVHAAKICTEDTALVPVLNTSKLESEIAVFCENLTNFDTPEFHKACRPQEYQGFRMSKRTAR